MVEVLILQRDVMPKLKKKRKFSDLFKRYKTYDSTQTGHGNVAEWRGAWRNKMGFEEAQQVIGSQDPLSILGLSTLPVSFDELKKHFRKIMLQNQSAFRLDATAEDQEKIKPLIAAYTTLEKRFQA